MSTPIPDDEKHAALREALRRDAARVQEPPFDPAMHRATLRRIRALADSGAAQWSWWLRPALAGAAALVVLALSLGPWPRAAQNIAPPATPPTPDFVAVLASTQAAVAGLSSGTSSPLPAWMSPTASLLALDLPHPPSINPKHPL